MNGSRSEQHTPLPAPRPPAAPTAAAAPTTHPRTGAGVSALFGQSPGRRRSAVEELVVGEVLGELDAIVLQLQQQKREVAAKRHEQQLEASRWRAEHDELRAEGDAARRARAAAEEAAAAAAAEAAALRAERRALEAEGASLREQQSALSAERAALRQEVWQSQQTARAEEMARREAEEKRRHQLEASVRSQLGEITASRLSLCLKHADATPASDALGAWRQHCAMRRGEADGRARAARAERPAALRRLVVALDAASLGAAVRAWAMGAAAAAAAEGRGDGQRRRADPRRHQRSYARACASVLRC